MTKKNTKNLNDMSLEELEAYNLELSEQRDAIRERQLEINRLMTEKTAEAEAKRKLENMSASERAALAQLLQPQGVASEQSISKL